MDEADTPELVLYIDGVHDDCDYDSDVSAEPILIKLLAVDLLRDLFFELDGSLGEKSELVLDVDLQSELDFLIEQFYEIFLMYMEYLGSVFLITCSCTDI